MTIITRKMQVFGLVQGIGFRPYVAELAEELELTGQVKNLGGVVEIIIRGEDEAVENFIYRLRNVSENGELPGCRVDEVVLLSYVEGGEAVGREETVRANGCVSDGDIFEKFSIVESGNNREQRRFLPVDLPTCDRCVAEMHDPENRRYRYPFISCTACGPRFSIQRSVPYDRDSITMDMFLMCDACYEEYTARRNIRRHAQTIACKECGPMLQFVTKDEHRGPEEAAYLRRKVATGQNGIDDVVAEAIRALKDGQIGAIKDIGGFHFACSTMNADAAKRLREFKNRGRKPFAVMFLNVDLIKEYCEVSQEEERLLRSSARPIVLLKKKKDFVPEICGESDRIGALLPCNPLQILLLEETGPLVMTSGNRGGEPIIISDEEMEQHIGHGIDFMLTHNREILTPLDDSIYQVNYVCEIDAGNEGAIQNRKPYVQLLRRARGLVPEPIAIKWNLKQDTFAAGGDLKATFALGRDELVYMSQYFGDLDDVRCGESRKRGKERMEQLLDIHPEKVVCDMHPGYNSVRETGAERKNLPIYRIQHHHAHVASVIAEHGLSGKVLGIACDGTGYGTDGTIWGSEFLLCEEGQMQRVGHFMSEKLVGGDAGAKDADMTLLSYMFKAKECGYIADLADTIIEQMQNEKFKQDIIIREMAWKNNINTAYSSSMGRLFDAVAALLDICHYNSYEGECAIKLEQAAQESRHIVYNLTEKPENILHAECVKIGGIWQTNGVKLLVDILRLKQNYSAGVLAYLFHHAIADAICNMTLSICEEQEVRQVALSGGTFLNRILTSAVISQLEKNGLQVYLNEKVPCGDGGLALGQMYLATYEA